MATLGCQKDANFDLDKAAQARGSEGPQRDMEQEPY